MRLIYCLFFLFSVTSCSCLQKESGYAYLNSLSSVVRISAFSNDKRIGTASATLVYSKNNETENFPFTYVFFTNAHVLKRLHTLSIIANGDTYKTFANITFNITAFSYDYKGNIVGVKKIRENTNNVFITKGAKNDVGVLIIYTKVNLKIKPAKLAASFYTNNIGDKVVSISCPFSMNPLFHEGIITQLHTRFEDSNFESVTLGIAPGSSGGGVFNKNNKLIGIISAAVFGFSNHPPLISAVISIDKYYDFILKYNDLKFIFRR